MVMLPVDWFGTPSDSWKGSPDRPFSMALWRVDQDARDGFKTVIAPDAHMVCVHLSGRMEWACEVDDRGYRQPCLPNTLCIGRAGEVAEAEYHDAHASFVHFYLPVRWFEEQASDINSDGRRRSIELIDPMNARSLTIGSQAKRAAALVRRGGGGARLAVEAAGLSLAATLIRNHSRHSHENACRGGLSPHQTRRVIEAMQATLGTGIGLADLAAIVGLSAPHFCRAFRQSTGLPPHRYQIALRIEYAQHLLAVGGCRIADVAAAVGYDDPAYFSRLFRAETGFTPREMRNEMAS